MGDTRRFSVVADLVDSLFPAAIFPAVADVAGGKGKLASKLAKRGYRPTIIDPRRTTRRPRGTRRYRSQFIRGMGRKYDLLVGLHPDGATEQLAASAVLRPVIIVPCCLHEWLGPEEGTIEQRIRARWCSLGVQWQEIRLPIQGRSLAFVVR